MNIFRNLKIRNKLILAFLSLIILMIAIGYVGYKSLSDIENKLNDIFSIRLPAIDYIIEADRDLQQLLVAERSIIFSAKSSEKFQSFINDYNENFQQSIDRIGKYEALVTTKEEKDILTKYFDARKEWEVISKQVVDGRLEDTREGSRLALDLTLGDASEKFEVMRTYLDQLTGINLTAAEEARKKAGKTYKLALMLFFGIIFIGIFISLVLTFLLSKNIGEPIVLITEGARKISLGDISLKGINKNKLDKINLRNDELGIISKAFGKLIEYQQEKVAISDMISNNNLAVNVTVSSEDDKLGKALSKTVTSLNNSLKQVNDAVEQVTSGSSQVAQASQSLSQGATEQASSLEEITSSITEINSQAKQNAENATEASGLTKQSMENATQGNTQMKELVTAMNDINNSADEIKKIVKVIDDIAFQTNLLALNANVEAARAGKYGKGFAVVAEEVRNLAGRSAESVQETTAMVEDAIKNIENGNTLVESTATQLTEIMESASKAADLVEEIATASREQTQGLDQINQGLGQVDQVTQSNTANAEESASAAEELAGQAEQLKSVVAQFILADHEDESNHYNTNNSEQKRLVNLQE
jgi:methyl-accepting chemotaxis protein